MYKPTNNSNENISILCGQIPDEIQMHIWTFLDTKTKLAYLRTKYTSEFIKHRLQDLPKNASCLKHMYSCISYVKPILVPFLNRHGSIYRNIVWNLDDRINYAKTLKVDTNCKMDTGYFNCLVEIILSGFTYYDQMASERDNDQIREYERGLIKLLCYHSTFKNT